MIRSPNGKPRQSNLRRAVSTTYYALFHCLASTSADMLVGGKSADRSTPAWQQAYRALEHGLAKNACMNGKIMPRFPSDVQDFADLFVTLQIKRHTADYDPLGQFFKSEVRQDIAEARSVIQRFDKVPAKDRRAFAAFVVFKYRKEGS